MPSDVGGGSLFCFCVRRCPLGALLHNILGFLIYACVAGDMICRMYGAVTYLFGIPLFFHCPWSCLLCLWFGVSPFVLFPSFFFDAHKPPSFYGTHFARWFGARIRDCTDYVAPGVRVGPVPFFVEGADNVCPVWWQGGLPRYDVPEVVGENAEEAGREVVVCLRREAVVAWGFVLPETVDGEGALFQLPPLGVVEDLREAADVGLGVRVQCVLGGRVLLDEGVLVGLEHAGWVVGEVAVLLPDRGDGAVAGVGHGVVEVADGLVGEFMLRIPFMLLGDALLPVDVPLLQVCPDVGHPRPAVVYVAAGSQYVGVEEGPKLLFCIPEVMEGVPKGRGRSVVLSLGALPETADDGGCAHGCE